jgi:hypothetical protein
MFDDMGIQIDSIEARDIARAAIHEASHQLVAVIFGGVARSEVWRNPVQDPDLVTWLGRVWLIEPPGTIPLTRERRELGIRRAPAHWLALFGLAGYVGEQVLRGDNVPWSIEESLEFAIEGNEISPTDLESIGKKGTERYISQVLNILLPNWPGLTMEADSMCSRALGRSFSVLDAARHLPGHENLAVSLAKARAAGQFHPLQACS